MFLVSWVHIRWICRAVSLDSLSHRPNQAQTCSLCLDKTTFWHHYTVWMSLCPYLFSSFSLSICLYSIYVYMFPCLCSVPGKIIPLLHFLAVQTVVFPAHNSKPCLLFGVDLETKANCLDSSSLSPPVLLSLLFSVKLTIFTHCLYKEFLEILQDLQPFFSLYFSLGFWTTGDVLVPFQ